MGGKTFERMARNPKDNWGINDVQTVCRENGLSLTAPRGGGSHYKVTGPGFKLTVPARRQIKPVYIRALVGFIRKMEEGR
jgi:hypothetical protein